MNDKWAELRRKEALREAEEASARRRWEIQDWNNTRRRLTEEEFDDDLLEEAIRNKKNSQR